MKNWQKTALQTTFNSTTDPAFLFSVGSAVLTWPLSKTASALGMVRAAFCLATRIGTELKKADVPFKRLPSLLDYYISNLGASIYTSSIFMAGTALFTALSIPEKGLTAAFTAASFAIIAGSGFFTGKTVSLDKDSKKIGTFNAISLAMTAVATSTLVGNTLDLAYAIPYHALTVLSAVAAAIIAPKNLTSYKFFQPEYLLTGACLLATVNYGMQDRLYESFAFGICALATFTVDCMKKSGGVVEHLTKSKNKDIDLQSTLKPTPP